MVRHCGLEVKKWLFKCLVIFSTLVVCYNWGIGFLKVEAYDKPACSFTDGCKCGASKHNDVMVWNQGYHGGKWNCAGDPINGTWSPYPLGGSETVEQVGCYLMSIAVLMKMSGQFKDFCPIMWLNYATGEGNMVDGNSCLINATNIAKIPGHENVFQTGAAISESDIASDGTASGGHQKIYKLACDLAEKGYYVVVHRDGHFMPLVKVVEAKNELGHGIVVSEGGTTSDDGVGCYIPYGSESVDGYFNKTMYLCDIRVFVCEKSPFDGAVHANGSSGSSGGSSDVAFAPTVVSLAHMLEEEYFVDTKTLDENWLNLPTKEYLRDSLGYEGIGELYDWEETISIQKADRVHHYVRAGVMLFGILITVYSILLFIAFQFDKVNNFVDLNALGMLSFNRFSVSPDERSTFGETSTKDGSKTKYLTFKNIVFVTCIGIALGIFLISGKAYSLVSTAINLVSDLFHDSNRLS